MAKSVSPVEVPASNVIPRDSVSSQKVSLTNKAEGSPIVCDTSVDPSPVKKGGVWVWVVLAVVLALGAVAAWIFLR